MKWIRIGAIVFIAAFAVTLAQGMRGQADVVATGAAEFFNRLLLVCGGSIGLFVGAVLVYFFRRQSLEARRMRDGAWPTRDIPLVSGWRRTALWLRGEAIPTAHYDPNLMVGPVLLTSAQGVYWPEPGCGWERQAALTALVERTNQIRATTPGDGVWAWPWAKIGRGNRLSAPEAKLLAGGYDKPAPPMIEVLPTPTAAEPTPTPTLRGLLTASPKDGISFGYSADAPDLATWEPARTPTHLRIHGQPRVGKTQTGLTLAVGALAKGWRVLILAPRGGKDWRDIAQFGAEVADVTRPAQFVDALRVVEGEFTRREAILQEYQAPDLASVPFANRPPRMVVFAEEYGAQRVNATTAEREEMDRIWASLSAQSGADGIHLVAIDQVPEHYERRVKANLTAVVFRLPQGPGMAAGYPRAHLLGPRQFHYEGDRWMSVNATPQLTEVLAGGGVIHEPLLGVRGAPFANAFVGVRPEVDTPATVRTNTPEGWYDWMVDWIATGHTGLLQEPASGVTEAAKVMATEAGRPADWENFKSLASDLARRIRSEMRAMPPGGS